MAGDDHRDEGATLAVSGLKIPVPGRSAPVTLCDAKQVDAEEVDAELELHSGEIAVVRCPKRDEAVAVARCLAGLVSPEKGRLRLEEPGKLSLDLHTRSAPDGDAVSYAPGGEGLLPNLTVLKHLRLALQQSPITDPGDEAVSELQELFGLKGMGDCRPSQLGTEQRTRLGLAVAVGRSASVVAAYLPYLSSDLMRALRAVLGQRKAAHIVVCVPTAPTDSPGTDADCGIGPRHDKDWRVV